MTVIAGILRHTAGAAPWHRAPRIAERSAGRDNNFNLIRMLAATGVMVSHAFPLALGPGTREPFQHLLKGDNLGRACVFVFFAVSGFYITRSFLTKREPARFVLARILRLYPGLAVMLLTTLAVGGLWFATDPAAYWSQAAGYAVERLTFTGHGDLPGVFAANPYPGAFNGSLWTLRYEVACYIGVLVAGLLGIFDRPRLFAVLALLFVVCCLLGPRISGRSDIRFLLYLGLPFLIGSAFCVWQRRIPLCPAIAAVLVVLAVMAHPTPLFRPLFVLALAYATFCLGFARIPLLDRYNRVGDYSYGIYIYAFPIQQGMAALGFVTPIGNLAAAFPVTLLCAILSWTWIESPALRLRPTAARLRRFRKTPM